MPYARLWKFLIQRRATWAKAPRGVISLTYCPRKLEGREVTTGFCQLEAPATKTRLAGLLGVTLGELCAQSMRYKLWDEVSNLYATFCDSVTLGSRTHPGGSSKNDDVDGLVAKTTNMAGQKETSPAEERAAWDAERDKWLPFYSLPLVAVEKDLRWDQKRIWHKMHDQGVTFEKLEEREQDIVKWMSDGIKRL